MYEFNFTYTRVSAYKGTASEAEVRAALAEITDENHWSDSTVLDARAAERALDEGEPDAVPHGIVALALSEWAMDGEPDPDADPAANENYTVTGYREVPDVVVPEHLTADEVRILAEVAQEFDYEFDSGDMLSAPQREVLAKAARLYPQT